MEGVCQLPGCTNPAYGRVYRTFADACATAGDSCPTSRPEGVYCAEHMPASLFGAADGKASTTAKADRVRAKVRALERADREAQSGYVQASEVWSRLADLQGRLREAATRAR